MKGSEFAHLGENDDFDQFIPGEIGQNRLFHAKKITARRTKE